MPDPANGPWFKFLLWALGIALSAIIGLQTTLHLELKGKIDRVTALLMSERDRIYTVLDKLCDKIAQHDAELARQREVIDHIKRRQDERGDKR